jgi:hypothetical protein
MHNRVEICNKFTFQGLPKLTKIVIFGLTMQIPSGNPGKETRQMDLRRLWNPGCRTRNAIDSKNVFTVDISMAHDGTPSIRKTFPPSTSRWLATERHRFEKNVSTVDFSMSHGAIRPSNTHGSDTVPRLNLRFKWEIYEQRSLCYESV